MTTAMIFAAGLGTRLRPLTDNIPKALVPVGGVPMLERVICRLRDAGVERCVVNACHLAPMIEAFLKKNDFGIPVELSLEGGGTPLETGGGIKHARTLIEGSCGEEGRFLVHNVDILSDLDLGWLMAQARKDSLSTLLLVRKDSERCLLFDDDMLLRGWMNNATGEVRSPDPLFDPTLYHKFSFCGIHMVSKEIFPLMEPWPENFGIMDFYLSVCNRLPIRGIVADNLKIIDIGSPSTLAAANGIFTENA